MEALNRMLIRARELDLFKGLKVGLGKHTEEITCLFFADNTILFYEQDEHAMLNVRCLNGLSSDFGIQY